jgi:hypothetical protein
LAAISYQIIDKEIKGMPKGIVTWFIDSKGFGFSICMAIAALLLMSKQELPVLLAQG